MKTLFVTDLDGTLLNSAGKVSERSVSLLNEAIGKGAHVTVATARTPATVSGLIEKVNINVPAIVMTGAALWHPVNHNYEHTVFLNPDVAKSLLNKYKDEGLPTFMYTLRDNKICIYHSGSLTDGEREFLSQRDHSPFKESFVPPSGESCFPERLDNVLLFYAMQPGAPTERFYKSICSREGINPIFYFDIFGEETGILEVFSPEASKARAIRYLAGRDGYDRIVAFGDNVNDLPMLREADVAVAVGNAIPEVKRAADVVIGRNDEDSVANYILQCVTANTSL